MTELPNMETTDFKTKAYSQRRRNIVRNRENDEKSKFIQKRKNAKKGEEPASSLISLMAMAVIACMVILAFALSGTSVINNATKGIKEVLQSDVPLDEALGKLKFVGNNISSVFGISRSAFILPFADAKLTAPYDEMVGRIVLAGKSDNDVVTCASGTVEMVGRDEEGQYIEMNHGGGTRMVYGKLKDVCVEEGQPIRQGDAIGKIGDDGKIFVALYQDGVPRDVSMLLGLKVD